MGVKALKEYINDSMNNESLVNEVFLKKNINESLISLKGDTTKISYTEYVADKLVKIFNAPQSRKFFLKCAWNLSEDTIWTAVENSNRRRVKSPVKYFVAICQRALQEI